MKRVALIGLALLASTLALTASASAGLGIAPLAAQDNMMVYVKGGYGHGQMHHGARGNHYGWGRGRGRRTAGTVTVTTDYAPFAGDCFRRPIAPTKANTCDMDGRADRRDQFSFRSVEACQPRPISTAIRIRSEWFFAPSFCLSNEVVLATVL
jgi:hypothetical protein